MCMNEPSSKEHVMTNILFIEDDGSRSPYDPNIHKTRVNKFLYWDTLLITGPQEYHNTLYKCYINNKDDQQFLIFCKWSIKNKIHIQNKNLRPEIISMAFCKFKIN